MARLTIQECIERITAPRNTTYLRAARRQEERLVMHTEPILENAAMPPAFREWLQWVASFLPRNKFERFQQLVTFPLETVDSTEVIFDELSKIFDAPDKAVRFEFTAPGVEQDFWAYVSANLNDENFWREKGWEAVRTAINSFLVVDLPREQRGRRPEPYYYLLASQAVHDVEVNQESGQVEYLCAVQVDGTMLCIDDNAYRRFHKPEGQHEWTLMPEGEALHSWYTEGGELRDGLGYAPVCSFWEHSIRGSRRLNKRGPLTNTLAKLDWLLFWKTSKKYLDLYGAYPIIVRYKEECDYKDAEGNHCEEGFINYQYTDPTSADGRLVKSQRACPACERRGIIGPGSDWSVEAPKRKEEVDLMENPVKIVEMSNDKLTYGVTETERLEREIQLNAVGRVLHEATKEAINEQQVRSQYEAQRAIMTRIREQVDASRQFVLETVARLRYGRYFLRGSVFGGREFFLQSPDEIATQYATAKKNGLPGYEVARIREAYSNTKFKADDLERQRSAVLADLDPYPDYTVQELRGFGVDTLDPDNWILKLNFMPLIRRFERENINVVEFGSLLAYDKKIAIIHKKLLEYVNDIKQKAKSGAQADGGGNGKPAPATN